jgi:uncharacterized membrane protein
MMRFYVTTLIVLPQLVLADEVSHFDSQILPIVRKYCNQCHNEEKSQGDLNLAKFRELYEVKQNKKIWEGINERLRAREMPPDNAPQLSDDERDVFLKWIVEIVK